MYIKLANIEVINKVAHITIIKDIVQDELTTFYKMQEPVHSYAHARYLHRTALSNANQLQSYLDEIFSNDPLFENKNENDILIEGNRLLANYCSSVSMLIDQIEKKLSKLDQMKLDDFKTLDSLLYDNKFEYRFFKLLRHYILHYELPFTKYYKCKNNGSLLVFEKSRLLYYKGWKHAKEDIEQMDDEIDIRPYINNMNIYIDILLTRFLLLLSTEIVNAFNEFNEFLFKHNIKSPAIIKYYSLEDYNKGNYTCNFINYRNVSLAYNDLKKHPMFNQDIANILPDWFGK